MPSYTKAEAMVSGARKSSVIPAATVSSHASRRKASRPGSWTAVIGASPCSVGATSSNPPSASSVARIRSARSGISLAGTWTPIDVWVMASWPRCTGV